MAITPVTSGLVTAQDKTPAASTPFTTAQAITAGDVGIINFAADNLTGDPDADNSEVTGVTDSAGNTWGKLAEWTNGAAAVGNGATISVWRTKATSTLAAGGTITVTSSGSITARAITGATFSVGSGNTLELVPGSLQTESRDALDPGTLTISGLANQEYLFWRAIACERPDTTVLTPTAGYTALTSTNSQTTGGSASTNMLSRGEYLVATGTGSTSNPSLVAQDNASAYFALREAAAGGGGVTLPVGAMLRLGVGR